MLKNLAQSKKTSFVMFAMVAMLASLGAMAGTDATFTPIVTLLTSWMQGSLGLVFALATFLIGMGIGIVKQSIMAVVVGLGSALVMYNAPAIIATIFTFGL